MSTERREVPLCRPSIGEAEIERVVEVLRSGWLTHGEYNQKMERTFAEYIGVEHAVAMSSCTAALQVALLANDIRGEVIVPTFTWVASANSVVTTGGTPVFCDVDGPTRNTTAELLAAHITPRTEAVMPVHYGGQPCNMTEIVALCERHGLLLIEDSAETLGGSWRGVQAGAFGLGCFSFFPTKNITTGEGGMLTCKDQRTADNVRALIAHGISSSTFAREKRSRPWLRAATFAGYNFRMPNPLAALGYEQMLRVDDFNTRRVALAKRYDDALADLPQVRTPVVVDGATHAYQMYTVEVDAAIRDGVLAKLREQGVGASVHFAPVVHLQPLYAERGGRPGMFPVAERLAEELITLPMFPDMSEDDQDWVIDCLKRAVASA
ncbi:MAG: DegT/DnrJ/EryC1/StrS aminotransferase family protein [Myxococcales bacterium]|nr:DegT/DnrJ/EryC1/StrS aminotransferase family protein [Myxococcales bacterium]